jgi:hypothetical protein
LVYIEKGDTTMSLKLAELQIAIPKTFDAGKVADQIQQQSAIQQSNAQAASERQLEKNRETVTKSTEASKTSSQDDEKERMEQERQNRKKREQEIKETKHPFKGNFVDFSG